MTTRILTCGVYSRGRSQRLATAGKEERSRMFGKEGKSSEQAVRGSGSMGLAKKSVWFLRKIKDTF